MPIIDENVLLACRRALRKEAGFAAEIARATPRLKNIGALGGAGLTLGALGGAGLGAARGYRHAREEGADVGSAAMSGVAGALGGAGRGALAGGLAGSLAGGLSPRDVSGLARVGGPAGAGARFGQRQLHSLTGMLSPQELEGVRGGAFAARQRLRATGTEGALKSLHATEAATGVGPGSMNLTSIPGYVQAAKEHGVGKVLSTSLKEQMANQPKALTALMLGVPAAAAGKAALGKEEFNEKGQGRGERIGEAVGGSIGGVAGGVMPLGGQLAVGSALGGAGKLVGRGIDRLRGRRPTPGLHQPGMSAHTLEPTESQNTPSERVMSPNAAGQRPEIGV